MARTPVIGSSVAPAAAPLVRGVGRGGQRSSARRGQGDWPRLRGLPAKAEAEDLAWELRRPVALRNGRLDDLEALCVLAGCRVRFEELRAARGGLQGLLLPRGPETFELVVDDSIPGGGEGLSEELKADVRRHRRRFLIAHELAHTFFYAWRGTKAHLRQKKGDALERFCDEFARALLVPPRLIAGLDPAPESVIAIQRRFDVSMEVAARALASSQEPRAFVALLLRLEGGPDLTRPQWRSADPSPRGRWWTGSLIGEALRKGGANGKLPWGEAGSRHAAVRHIPARRQLILVARRP